MWIAIGVVVLIIFWAIAVYNGFIQSKMKVDNAWSQIEVQLQRRFDLIPNLVNCVKGYMSHESDVLTKVTELRTAWAGATSVDEKAKLDSELTGALKTIMAVSENYPDLKANQNFSELQEELKNTEDKVSFSRQFYNDTVSMYNMAISVVPASIIASIFGFKPRTLFEVDNQDARKSVKVDF